MEREGREGITKIEICTRSTQDHKAEEAGEPGMSSCWVVHMAFHSAHETLHCLATAEPGSTVNTVLQTFSLNEVSKLIMLPGLFLTG